MKTLITAGTTSGAFTVERMLGNTTPVIFGDNSDFPVPGILTSRFIPLPHYNLPTFVHNLLTLCIDREIGAVFPLRSGEIHALSTAKLLFSEFGIYLCVPSKQDVERFLRTAKSDTLLIIRENKLTGHPGRSSSEAQPEDGIFNLLGDGTYSIYTAD